MVIATSIARMMCLTNLIQIICFLINPSYAAPYLRLAMDQVWLKDKEDEKRRNILCPHF